MTILVTGSNGAIGSQVVAYLAAKGADVHALVRNAPKSRLPEGVKVVQGDLLDVDSMRAALAPIKTLFQSSGKSLPPPTAQRKPLMTPSMGLNGYKS